MRASREDLLSPGSPLVGAMITKLGPRLITLAGGMAATAARGTAPDVVAKITDVGAGAGHI